MVKTTSTFLSTQQGTERLDSGSMRAQNLALLLRLIWNEKETSRADLARETGLSRSAASALVDMLLKFGLIEEIGLGRSQRGRRPVLLRFVDDAFLVTGVDLGATHISVVVSNFRGEIKASRTIQHDTRNQPQSALKLVQKLVAEIQQETYSSQSKHLGIGVAVASPIHPDHPGCLSPIFWPEWRTIDLMKDLFPDLNESVLIGNDANLGALAESWWGAGKGLDTLAFIKLGTGVGAGFIIDHHIYKGHGGTAGEIGHLVIDPQGPKCVCGLNGCLATFVGTPALLQAIKHKQAEYPHSLLFDDDITLQNLIQAVKDGDLLAREIIKTSGQYLGLAVAGLLNLMNPKLVVLGGEITKVGGVLLHALLECIQSHSMWSTLANSRVVLSELGEYDVALGAATLVIQSALEDPSRFPIQ